MTLQNQKQHYQKCLANFSVFAYFSWVFTVTLFNESLVQYKRPFINPSLEELTPRSCVKPQVPESSLLSPTVELANKQKDRILKTHIRTKSNGIKPAVVIKMTRERSVAKHNTYFIITCLPCLFHHLSKMQSFATQKSFEFCSMSRFVTSKHRWQRIRKCQDQKSPCWW